MECFDGALEWYLANVKPKPKKGKIFREKRLGRPGCVYFLMEPEGTPIKIGFSKERPEERLVGCQTGNPRKLYLATCRWHDSAEDIERELHLRFSEKRLFGEWFQISFVEGLKALDAYEGWKHLPLTTDTYD
jgi:hypothetical protein